MMALNGQHPGDIRATLALSQEEAQNGTTRTLNLPGGRQLTLSLPPGLRDGQMLRLEGHGQIDEPGGQPGSLILTIAVASMEQAGSTLSPQPESDAPTQFIPPPPPRPISSPSHPTFPIPETAFPAQDSGRVLDPYSNYSSQASTFVTPPSPERSAHTPTPLPASNPTPIPASTPTPIPDYLAQPQYMQPQTQAQTQGTSGQPVVQQSRERQGGRPRRLSTGMAALLLVIALLVIGGSGLLFYTTVYQPGQLHAQATATAQARANASATDNAISANQTATEAAELNNELTATANVYTSIYTQATSGTLVLNENMTGNGGSRWNESSNCVFTSSGYVVKEPDKGFFNPCVAAATNYSNFAFQVQMKITQGDAGGMLFRADSANSKYYLFNVSSDGSYELYLYVDNKGSNAQTLVSGSGETFNTGTNQTNTLAVVARGNSIYLYIDKAYVNSYVVGNGVHPLNSGQIGLIANATSAATTVIYSQAQVWQL